MRHLYIVNFCVAILAATVGLCFLSPMLPADCVGLAFAGLAFSVVTVIAYVVVEAIKAVLGINED